MKSLVEYLNEKKECENCDNKTYEKNSKETLDALASSAGENISYNEEDGTVSFTISKDNYAEATAFLTALKDYVKKLAGTTTKRASDSAYADKVSKMERKVEELDELIASYSDEQKTSDAAKTPDENE